MLIWIFVILAAVAADQLTKQLVLQFLDRNESLVVIPKLFRFTYVENRGAAFGMLDEHRWVFMVVSTVAIVLLLFYMFKFSEKSKLLRAGLSLIIGGGIGNMIDRVAYGYVVDFIDFYAFPEVWMWVFNVADACVCVGAGVVALYLIIDIVKESKKLKEENTADETEEKNEENKENKGNE